MGQAKTGPITVIGSINMDLVTQVSGFPRPGETVAGSELRTIPGGKGANQAVAAARAGAAVHFVGCVGADDFGRVLLRGLREQGIQLRHVKREPRAPTGVALITVDENGENQIVISAGANAKVTATRVQEAERLIARSRMILLQREIPDAAVRRALSLARRSGTVTVLNPAPAAPLPPTTLRQVDILVVNAGEAATLLGRRTRPEVAVRRLAEQTAAGIAILTAGKSGAWFAHPDVSKPARVPAFAVKVVDTTAAGDTFVGAFSVHYLESGDIASSIRFAAAAAALAVSNWGAQPSIPTRGQIDRFLKSAGRRALS